MQNIDLPLVSIIIAAYNAELYIKATLDSIFNQSYPNIEIVVVNDGSKDSTLEILQKQNDSRLKIFTQVNKGQDAAFNYGYSKSTGNYIKFMDADDIISENTIKLQVEALVDSEDKVAYGEWYRFFGESPTQDDIGKPMSYWKDMSPMDFLTQDEDGPMLQCAIMMMPRTLVDKAGLWNEELILFNDTEYFTRVILKSNGVVFTKGAQLFYRSGLTTSLTSQKTRKYYESTYKGTNLLAETMLQFEDSKRVRQIIANIYFRRLYDMYPFFHDLAQKHQQKVKEYGGSNLTVRSGRIYNILNSLFGWKIAKRSKLIINKLF